MVAPLAEKVTLAPSQTDRDEVSVTFGTMAVTAIVRVAVQVLLVCEPVSVYTVRPETGFTVKTAVAGPFVH